MYLYASGSRLACTTIHSVYYYTQKHMLTHLLTCSVTIKNKTEISRPYSLKFVHNTTERNVPL